MQKICKVCGKQYKAKRESSKYCSRLCYTRFRQQNMTLCETCGRAFQPAGVETVCPKCLSEIPPYQPPEIRMMPSLSVLSGDELLHYGKISVKRQLLYLEAERERAAAIALRNRRRDRQYD